MNHNCSTCEMTFECKMSQACREEHDNLETIFWHPYPQEKPIMDKWYLITRDDGFVTVRYFFDMQKFDDIIAWAELPKPYEEANE